jgi:hypothetical protein
MRWRVIVGIVALGCTAATVANAWQQRVGNESKNQRGSRVSRAQVIELRAALEVLELEHEAEKSLLLDRMKSNLSIEAMSSKQLADSSQMSLYLDVEFQERTEARERERQKRISALGTQAEHAEKSPQINLEYDEANKRDMDETIKRAMRAAKDDLSRRKRQYLRHAKEIADKRLELAEVEKRHNSAK